MARVNALIGKEIPETVVRTIIAALEVKVLAEKDGVLLFVEVKLRTNLQYGAPREYVTVKKQEKLRAAALLYLSERELDVPARFDVAEVYTDVRHSAGKTRIAYIENAF